jgi:hypothetical protein
LRKGLKKSRITSKTISFMIKTSDETVLTLLVASTRRRQCAEEQELVGV